MAKILSLIWMNEAQQAQVKKVIDEVQPETTEFVALPDQFRGLELRVIQGGDAAAEYAAFVTEQIADTEILLAGYVSPEQFQAAQSLQWWQVPFAGVNRVVAIPGMVESEVVLTNAAGIMAAPLADQVLGYIIAHSRRLLDMYEGQKQHKWGIPWLDQTSTLIELAGRTVGIIGYGRIGQEIAKRAQAFGMTTIGTKSNPRGDFPYLDQAYGPEALAEVLALSDYVVVAAPSTPETQGLIGMEQFKQMKPTGYFINIARGALVKEAEMIEALRQNVIAGAALDVFEVEPLPASSPLWDLPNVFITPHSSGNFSGFRDRAYDLFCDNLRRYLTGGELINVVDKARGY